MKTMLRCFCQQVLFFVVALFFSTPAFAEEKIPASPCGPMASLRLVHKSRLYLGSLLREDRSPLTGENSKTYAGKYYILPDDAKEDANKFTAFIKSELDHFGSPKAKTCTELLAGKTSKQEPVQQAQQEEKQPTVIALVYDLSFPASLVEGQALTIRPKFWMLDGELQPSKAVKTESSNPSVLEVVKSEDGSVKVRAVRPGEAILTLSVDDKTVRPTKIPLAVTKSPNAGIDQNWLWLLLFIPVASVIGYFFGRRRLRAVVQAELSKAEETLELVSKRAELYANTLLENNISLPQLGNVRVVIT